MNRIIEAFGYEECLRLAKYPDNCNFNLNTRELKHSRDSATVGEFVGFVTVFEIQRTIKEYEKELWR